jgi:hypothetical protein
MDSSLGVCVIEPYISRNVGEKSNTINGLEDNIVLRSDNSTTPFSSGLNNNWFVPALFKNI